ncbi:MAG TPA: DUF1223 domain-containing protein [Puia sp.]|nr:DUF1223 domain-containing protein [Puia sp.]
MKPIKILAPAFILLCITIASAAIVKAQQKSNPGFAVVELFTSEGCSSCPPADQLVAKVEKENEQNHIYILSYHVDYWDRLGWKDRFSDADYTKRQNRYANWLKLESIYTPQIVVNGRTEFVGSNENALRKAISAGWQQTAVDNLVLKGSIVNNQLSISYQLYGPIKNSDLAVALVQKSAQTKVGGGENSGRTLSHVQIVRKLVVEPVNANSGTISIVLPPDYNENKWELIGFVQNETNGAIQSAAESVLTSY